VLRWAYNRIRWEFAKRRMHDTTTPTANHEFNNAAIEAAFLQAVSSYKMQSWSGNIKLIRPPLVGKWHVGEGRWIDDERAYVLHDNDWGQFTPQIEVIEVPGDHDSMVLEPNVRVMAAKIKPIIEAAQ